MTKERWPRAHSPPHLEPRCRTRTTWPVEGSKTTTTPDVTTMPFDGFSTTKLAGCFADVDIRSRAWSYPKDEDTPSSPKIATPITIDFRARLIIAIIEALG